MTNYTWTIVNMDRLTADGFVVTVHYNVSATGGGLGTDKPWQRHCGSKSAKPN
jgi:hypothetical protein